MSESNGGGRGEAGGGDFIFTYLDVGTYYIMVAQVGATVYGENTEYDLRVIRDDQDYGHVEGYVTDSLTGFGVSDADVVVFGLASPDAGKEEEYAERIDLLAGDFPTVFFVKNSSLFIGELLGTSDDNG